jgi:hypothetical protein
MGSSSAVQQHDEMHMPALVGVEPGDPLRYRFITLPNKLSCLLISDPDTDKAAASAEVRRLLEIVIKRWQAQARWLLDVTHGGSIPRRAWATFQAMAQEGGRVGTTATPAGTTATCCKHTQVRAGSLAEPDEVPGLAHLTEHMLFYASERYPKEDDYSRFIQARGGHTNAYTASEATNYSVQGAWLHKRCTNANSCCAG